MAIIPAHYSKPAYKKAHIFDGRFQLPFSLAASLSVRYTRA